MTPAPGVAASARKGVTCRTGAAGTGRREATGRAVVRAWEGEAAGSAQTPVAVGIATHLAQVSSHYVVPDGGEEGQLGAR